MNIHILAAIAEHEREMISRRTREALAAAKDKGAVLGGFRGTCISDSVRQKSITVRRSKAKEYQKRVLPMITDLREMGLSLSETARELNKRQIYTVRGGRWTAMAVRRIWGKSKELF